MRYFLYDEDDNQIGTMRCDKDLTNISLKDLTQAAKQKLGLKEDINYIVNHIQWNRLVILEYITIDSVHSENYKVKGKITY